MQRQGWAGSGYCRADDPKNINIVSMREHVDTGAHQFFAPLIAEQYTDGVLLLNDLRAFLPNDAIISINPTQRKNYSAGYTRISLPRRYSCKELF